MQQAGAILEKLEIPHEIRVMSASRNPDLVDEYARTAFERGLQGHRVQHRHLRGTWPRRSPRERWCR